jgi:BON domain-containing protein
MKKQCKSASWTADQRSAVITERLQSVARESGVATSTLTVIIVLVLIVAAAVVLVVNNGIARRSAELAAASKGPPTIAPQPQPAPEIIKQPAQSVFEGGLTSGHEDANMQAIAKERLNEDLELGGVVTTVSDARAVLTGAVGSEAAKAKAEQLVKGVRGVKSVDNKIVVSS